MAKRRTRKKSAIREKDFETWIEKRAKDFAEEIEEMGRKFEVEIDRKSRKHGKEHEWHFGMFGPIGPLFGSAAGILCLAIGIWLLNLINIPLESNFISSISNFLFSNLHWFFLLSLFFGYNDYFSKNFPDRYWLVSPAMTGVGITIVAWILAWAFGLVSDYTDASIFPNLSAFLGENLWSIFALVTVLGYIIVFAQKIVMRVWE
jgi:uncharacterized membrane protein